MTKHNLSFLSLDFLDENHLKAVEQLEKESAINEGLNYKLELGYKKTLGEVGKAQGPCEFMCYNGQRLVAYLGVLKSPAMTYEINGLVHPEYRRL